MHRLSLVGLALIFLIVVACAAKPQPTDVSSQGSSTQEAPENFSIATSVNLGNTTITRYHDDEKKATCWVARETYDKTPRNMNNGVGIGIGISCIPDHQLEAQ